MHLHQSLYLSFPELVVVVAMGDFIIESCSQSYQQDKDDYDIYHTALFAVCGDLNGFYELQQVVIALHSMACLPYRSFNVLVMVQPITSLGK